MIRVRPFNEKEKCGGGSKKCVVVENQSTIILESKPDNKVFNFDYVGDEQLEQSIIFNQIAKPIADYCLEGYNGSIFAYGQTGSGKTFSIQGPNVSINGEESACFTLSKDMPEYEMRGLMPRSFEYIFDRVNNAKIKATQQNDHYEFIIRCSYLEIYNEQIMDLLEPGSYNLHIREDIKKGVYVEGLVEENISSAQNMMELIAKGSKNRHTGSTLMNSESSRSHSVLTTIIETKSMTDGGVWNIKTSRFHIIDLAGSERAKSTNTMGDRLKEAGMINKSLSALGNVINSLVDISEGKTRHVHYRDSKLTFLLRDSLGGNSKTVIIANISPSCLNQGETLSTLKFAQRAKLIRNKAIINEDSSGTIYLLKSEIGRLKKELAIVEQNSQNMGFQCIYCKNNIVAENQNSEYDMNESMLIDILPDETDPDRSINEDFKLNETLKQRFVDSKQCQKRLRKRVIDLESLLSSNLDNLTSQQKYYDNELQKNHTQTKKLQISLDSYEKQGARDKMIIKFREDRIKQLEQSQPSTQDDKQTQINQLKKEIAVWKESMEHNAKAAKLFTEKAQLQVQLESLKKELKTTPDSLNAQVRSLTELNESLNDYLKQYCEESKKEVDNELQKIKYEYNQQMEQFAIQIEEQKLTEQKLHEKYAVKKQQWKMNLINCKEEIEFLNKQFQKDKEDLQLANQQTINTIKLELQQISEGSNEQVNQCQKLKLQIIENQQHFESQIKKLQQNINQLQNEKTKQELHAHNQKDKIQQLTQSIAQLELMKNKEQEELNQKIEFERSSHFNEINLVKEQLEKSFKDHEKEILNAFNEKGIVEEQCEELVELQNSLYKQNQDLQENLLYKEEEIALLLRQKNEYAQSLTENHEQNAFLVQLQGENDKLNNQKIEDQSKQVEEIIIQKNELMIEYNNVVKQYEDLQKTSSEVKQKVDTLIEEKKHIQDNLDVLRQEVHSKNNIIKNLEAENKQQNQELTLVTEVTLKDLQEQQYQELQNKQNELETLQVQKGSEIEQLECKIVFLQKAFQTRQDDLISELKEDKIRYQQLSVVHTNTLKQHEIETEKLIQNHDVTFNQQQIYKQTEVEQLCQQQLQSSESLKMQHENDMLEVQLQEKLKYKNKMREAKIKFEEQVNQNQQEKENIKQSKDIEIKALKNYYEHQLNIVIDKHDTLKDELETKIQDLQAKILELKSDFSKEILINEQNSIKQIEENAQLVIQSQEKIFQLQASENKGQVEAQTQQIAVLEQQLESNKIQNIQEIEQLTELTQKKLYKMQSEIEIKNSQFEVQMIQQQQIAQEQQFEQYQKQILEKDTIVVILQEENMKIQDHVENLTQQANELEDKIGLQIDQIQIITSEKDQLQQKLQNQDKQIQQQVESQNCQLIMINKQKAEFEKVIKQLKVAQEQKTFEEESKLELFELLNQKEQSLEQMNQDMDDLNNQRVFEEQQKLEVIETLKETQNECQQLNQQIKDLISENNTISQKFASIKKQKILEQKDKSSSSKQLNEEILAQKQSHDITIEQIVFEYSNKVQEQQKQYQLLISQAQSETESYKTHCKELNTQLGKIKQRSEDQNDMLKTSKETISDMVQKENELMKELEKKINELKDHQDKWKKRVQDAKDEKDSLRKDWDRYRKENENLRELVNLKDRQIEDYLGTDDQYGQINDKIQKENKELRAQVGKREFEMKEVVRTLKFYSEEKNRLEKELEQIKREFDSLGGHNNPSQKIQHHLKIKEENNKLKEDNFKLLEEIKKKNDLLSKTNKQVRDLSPMLAQPSMLSSLENLENHSVDTAREDLKKLKNENLNYKDTISRVLDHILSQVGLMKMAGGLSDDMNNKIMMMHQNGSNRVKNAMEIISLISNTIQTKERDLKELQMEKIRVECKLEIVEKEKNLCKQQLDHIQNNSNNSFIQNTSTFLPKSPANGGSSGGFCKQEVMLSKINNSHHYPSQSRLHMMDTNVMKNQSIQDGNVVESGADQLRSKLLTHSPLINLRQVKENISTKKDSFTAGSGYRNASSKRTAYLSNNLKQ